MSAKTLRKLASEVRSVERALRRYKTYPFSGKDPIIATLKRAAQGKKLSEIALTSGVSAATLAAWFSGPTKRPQFATVKAVATALGLSL